MEELYYWERRNFNSNGGCQKGQKLNRDHTLSGAFHSWRQCQLVVVAKNNFMKLTHFLEHLFLERVKRTPSKTQ